MCAKSFQLCLTLFDPSNCSPPGSSVHGILQARTLEWVAVPPPGGLPHPGVKLGSHVSWIGRFFTSSATFVVVQSLSCIQLFVTQWTAAHLASLSFIFPSLPRLMSIESVMPSNHLVLCSPLLFLPSIFPSIGVFSSESALHIRWPKHWSFSFSISPSNEYSGLISFRIDWFDLLAVQGTLKSLLQYHTIRRHQFFSAKISL